MAAPCARAATDREQGVSVVGAGGAGQSVISGGNLYILDMFFLSGSDIQCTISSNVY